MKICLIGPFPNPVGGVSIHLQRLGALLQERVDVIRIDESPHRNKGLINMRKGDFIVYMRYLRSADLVHIHSSIMLLRFFNIILSKIVFRKKTILTIHSLRMYAVPCWQNWLYSICDRVIVVNESYSDKIRIDNILHMPAFLPPVDDGDLPQSIKSWISLQKKEGKKIAACNAFRLDSFNGVSIYGLDLAVDLAKLIVANNDNAAIIYVVSNIGRHADLFEKYRREIENFNLGGVIFLVPYAVNFPALIKLSDLVLRLTCTDGDALTVRESLWCGVNVLASDVVIRPEGCTIFRSRDLADLYGKFKNLLSADLRPSAYERVDYLDWYLKLYQGS